MSFAPLRARGPLVVTFHRGVWCRDCNMALQALQDALADIAAAAGGCSRSRPADDRRRAGDI